MMKKFHSIRYIKRHKRVSNLCRILALFVVSVMSLLIFQKAAASEKLGKITISAESAQILQGEAMPELGLKIDADIENAEHTVLNAKTGYSIEDLKRDLEQGNEVSLVCKGDTNTEGSYAIQVKLDASLKAKLSNEWVGLVEVAAKDGTLKVKNPVGEWEQDKFKKYDGSYAAGEFIVSKGTTYYFDKDGVKVTGWQEIGDASYQFDEQGVLEKNCWKDHKDARYYLGDNGAALKGWQEIEGTSYYFGTDGKMVTGKQTIGLDACEFDKDGKLVSRKEHKVDPGKPMVALTFDDGPGERTGELLDQLEKYGAHATFFMLGKKVNAYPDVLKKMKDTGCELGNHSYDHAKLTKLAAAGVAQEVTDTNNNIQNLTGGPATVMRPPYGAINDVVKASVGMPMILWNIDTLDWKTRNAQTTIDTTMASVKDGDIILMHDIHTESVDAALVLIPRLQEAGYQLVTVSEMAAAKGVELKAGEKYTDF